MEKKTARLNNLNVDQIKTQKRKVQSRAGMGEADYLPLFETKMAKGRVLFKLYAASMLMGICLICTFRAIHAPAAARYSWIGLFMAEVWFTLYWLITQLVRWNPVHHVTFKQRLSNR